MAQADADVNTEETALQRLESFPRFRQLAATAASQAQAASQYGVELFQAKDIRRAAIAFEAATQLNAAEPLNWNNYGVALNSLGQGAQAIAMFEKSLSINRNQPQIWLNLANTLSGQNRKEEAADSFRIAAETPAYAAEALTGLGTMAFEELRYAEALDAYRAAEAAPAASGPARASLHASHGAAAFQLGLVDEAATAYRAAATLDPAQKGYAANADFLTMLQGLIAGDAATAVTTYAQPLTDDHILVDSFNRALLFLTTFQHTQVAQELVREWLQYYPDDAEAEYFRQVLGGKRLERASKNYIVQHFDTFADKMSEELIKHLDYHVPEKLARLLSAHLPDNWRGDVLDAGCGTGLMGQALEPIAKTLWGVDLAPRMIGRAAQSKLYTSLTVADLAEFMHGYAGKFDLVAAADVLIYFGRLEPFFAAAASALRPGGWMVFSIETMDAGDFRLMPNGRFTHSKPYVEIAAGSAFQLIETADTILRIHNGEAMKGALYLFHKKP